MTFAAFKKNFVESKHKKITQYCFCYKAIYDGEAISESIPCHDNISQSFYWISLKDLDNYKILPMSNYDKVCKSNVWK